MLPHDSTPLLVLGGLLVAGVTSGCGHGSIGRDDHDAIARAVGAMVSSVELATFADAASLARGEAPPHAGTEYTVSCTDASGNQLLLCSAATDRADISVDADSHHGTWAVTNVQTEAVRFDGMGNTALAFDDGDRHYTLDAQVRYDRIQVSPNDRRLVFGYATYYTSIDRTGGDGDVALSLEAFLKIGEDGNAILAIDGEESYRVELATGAISPL